VRNWYYSGSRDLAWRYMRQMHKSDQVQPKPKMQDVEWANDDYPLSVMRELKETGRLAVPRDSGIVTTETMWATTPPGTPMPPQLMALCAVLVGMEQWRMDAARRI